MKGRNEKQLHHDWQYLKAAVIAGRATKEIAEDMGVSVERVREMMRRTGFLRHRNAVNGVKMRPRGPGKPISMEEVSRRLLARPKEI